MSFDISLKGPRRSFVVESFIAEGSGPTRTMARFAEGSDVKIAYEAGPSLPVPPLRIADIPGMENAVARINEFLTIFDLPASFKLSWEKQSCGLLLCGPHGIGKSHVIKMICGTGWGKVFKIDAQMSISALRDLFEESRKVQQGIIVIDDIETLFSKDESKSAVIEKVLGQEMDDLAVADPSHGKPLAKILVLGATAFPGEIPVKLRTPGRFNTEVLLPIPDAGARKRILKSLIPVESSETQLNLLERLGEVTHAYTARDLELLKDKAAEKVKYRNWKVQESDQNFELLQEDIDKALLDVRPTVMHGVTLQPPKVKWDEIGGQGRVKKALRRVIELPIRVKFPGHVVSNVCLLSVTVSRLNKATWC
jgi:AAA family ATPase